MGEMPRKASHPLQDVNSSVGNSTEPETVDFDLSCIVAGKR